MNDLMIGTKNISKKLRKTLFGMSRSSSDVASSYPSPTLQVLPASTPPPPSTPIPQIPLFFTIGSEPPEVPKTRKGERGKRGTKRRKGKK